MIDAAKPTARERSASRLPQVARAALAAFLAGGYRLTQIAHVSERLGMSVGSIYRYVESKEALFQIAALASLDRLPDAAALPVKVRGLEAAVEAINEAAAADPTWPRLRERVSRLPSDDPKADARDVAEALFDAMFSRASYLGLLERCAQDVPEIAEYFETRIRRRLTADMVTWAVRRGFAADGGRADTEALVRGAVAGVGWLAKDQPETALGAAQARRAAIRLFANAFD